MESVREDRIKTATLLYSVMLNSNYDPSTSLVARLLGQIPITPIVLHTDHLPVITHTLFGCRATSHSFGVRPLLGPFDGSASLP